MLRFATASLSRLGSLLFVLLALVLALPVLAVLASWLQWTPQTLDLLREMATTVLPDYAWTSALLCLLVAVGVTVLGLGTAAMVTLFEFRGRSAFVTRPRGSLLSSSSALGDPASISAFSRFSRASIASGFRTASAS